MNVYSQKTKFLSIPVRDSKDKIDGVTELKKWQKVENVLLCSSRMMRHCAFIEGKLTLFKTDNGKINASLNKSPDVPEFEGVIKGKYLNILRPIVWENIGIADHAYLYISPCVGSDFSECNNFSRPCKTREDAHLVAIVDTKNMTINMNPPDKLSTDTMANHSMLSENPHGPDLIQSNIVSDKIVISKEAVICGNIIRPISERVFDVVLNGIEGIIVDIGFVVNFVTYSSRDNLVNKVWFGYNGEDENVLSSSQVCVYSDVINSKVKIMVW